MNKPTMNISNFRIRYPDAVFVMINIPPSSGRWPGQRSRGCPMQPSVGCVGIFVWGATRFTLQDTSRPEATEVKNPAQPNDGWTGHPRVYRLPRVLARAPPL